MNTNNNEEYRFSFFKPTTKEARVNRNLTVILVTVWAVCIFGFHFVLKFIEEQVPEEAYVQYESVWDNVKEGKANVQEKQTFVASVLSVLGKVTLNPADRPALDNAVSATVYSLYPDSLRSDFKTKVGAFEKQRAELTSLKDEAYKQAKIEMIKEVAPVVGLKTHTIKAKLLPLELNTALMEEFTDASKVNVPNIMSKYLIHNRSVLTDTKFLGFPFHYFYTAVFLLILFVGLCWVYCRRIDQVNKQLGIEE